VEDYGKPIDRHDWLLGVDWDVPLGRDRSDSDSSIDLHTPLP
jgi:hypothetical protein